MRPRHLLLLALLIGSSLCVRAQDEEVIAKEAGGGDSAPPAADAPAAEEAPKKAPKKKKAPVISVASADAQAISASGKKLSSTSADFGSKLLAGTSLDGGASVEITFAPKIDGAAAKPQQAMLLLVPAEAEGLAAYAAAKAKKDGSYAVTLTQSLIDKQLGPVSGELSVTLLLGDPSAPKGVRWDLGTVKATAEDGAKPAPAYRTARVQPVSNFKPNIAHIFRAPEKRPAAVVSLAFAGLALAPLAVLALWLLGTGALSLANFPSGPGALWALLFHGGIGALLVLYWLFWTQLNLAQTLPLALGLGVATAAVGYKALSALADARLQQERSGATAVKKTQ